MEDGPESLEGRYEYGGRTYRLEERDSEVWRVYDGEKYLGIIEQFDATSAEPWMHYTAKSAGEENEHVPSTDDFVAALDHLIEASCE